MDTFAVLSAFLFTSKVKVLEHDAVHIVCDCGIHDGFCRVNGQLLVGRCDVLIHTTKASTSKYAFDGSGTTNRRSVYHYEHGNKKYNYSVCKFQNGKIYNCDLNASYNIGARFFLREYEKLDGCPKLPPVPMRTLDTLLTLLYSSDEKAA